MKLLKKINCFPKCLKIIRNEKKVLKMNDFLEINIFLIVKMIFLSISNFRKASFYF